MGAAKDLGEKAGVVKKDKSAYEIMQENFTNKKNVQERKKYYHKYKIAFTGTNDVMSIGAAMDANEGNIVEIYNDNRKNILSKPDFDIKKYTGKKNETAQYLCQEIMSANESDFSSLRKETAKYEK